MDIADNILDLAKFDVAKPLGEFGTSIQPWYPILGEDLGYENDLFKQGATSYCPLSSPFRSYIWFLTRKPYWDQRHMRSSELYLSMKQALLIMKSKAELALEMLQIDMMIMVYEPDMSYQNRLFEHWQIVLLP